MGILLSSYFLRLKLGSLQAAFQIFRHPIASNRIQWDQRTLPPFPFTCKTGALPPSIRQSHAGYSRKKLDQGFCFKIEGSLADAQRAWPLGVAIGKLSVVRAPGR